MIGWGFSEVRLCKVYGRPRPLLVPLWTFSVRQANNDFCHKVVNSTVLLLSTGWLSSIDMHYPYKNRWQWHLGNLILNNARNNGRIFFKTAICTPSGLLLHVHCTKLSSMSACAQWYCIFVVVSLQCSYLRCLGESKWAQNAFNFAAVVFSKT